MAITKAQQARQLYKNGGSMEDIGFSIAKPSKNGSRPGYRRSNYDSSGGGTKGQGFEGGRAPERGDADGPNRQQKAPKKQKAPKRKPKKTKKNTAPTLNAFEKFRLAGLKNLYDQKSGNKKPGIGFSNLLNYANPSLDFYESTSDTDIMDTGYGLSGKNLTDMDRLADAINLGEKTGNLNQRQFEEAFYGPEGNKFIPNEIGENDIYIPPVIEEEKEEEEEDVPISLRFMADGGRAAFQEGGGIFPRIDKLGNKVSSAEQELAAINSRLDTAQSSLGGQGGQNGGGGIMNNSILPDSPFPNIAEPAEEGDMNNSILPDSPFPNVAEPENTIADNISVNPIGSPENNAPIADNISIGGGRVPGAPGNSGIDLGLISNPGPISGAMPLPDPSLGYGNPGASVGGILAPPAIEDVPYNIAQPATPPPFMGRPALPPQTDLGQYTKPTENQLQPLPGGQGGQGVIGGGQLLTAGPRIPQPTITPGTNLQTTPLQTAISGGGGLAGLTGYGKPIRSPAVGDPRTGAQQIDGNLAQMMMRGGFAEGGMPEYEGGIMDLESGRQQYFLGKLVKKATRAVKKVVKSPFGKALILGGLTFGIPGVNQGFFSKGLMGTKSGLGFKKFLGDKILGEATMKSGGVQKSGGLLNFIKNNKALSGIVGGSLLAGITAPKSTYDAEQEDDFVLDIPEQYRFYADGGEVEPVAKETMPLLDMDNQEMDLRAEGGFVPIGRMEKADDVPARLSKNEFVFTADAVRNAGEGDIDKGAEVMYNMMKNLESGGEVSEKSQGLDGAREMFQTSQRLEEVL